MAKNRELADADNVRLNVSAVNGSGAGNLVLSGDPVVVGDLPGVALTDEDSDGFAVVQTNGAYRLSVTGTNDGGNVAVASGDILYWDDAEGQVNKEPTGGKRFGYAIGTVGSGQTGEIIVKVGY